MATTAQPKKHTLPQDALQSILSAHDVWLSSGGDRGDRADLSNTDLADADLSGINLTAANLAGADLSGADLSHTILDKVSAPRADFSHAELNQASLVGANLTWADLSKADLSGAVLTDATLSDVELVGARLVRADFTGAELDGANLIDADLDGAIMIGADMSGARFSETDDNFDGELDVAFEADQDYDDLTDETISELPDADDLRSADSSGADSSSGVPLDCAGPEADLQSADSSEADLSSGVSSDCAGPEAASSPSTDSISGNTPTAGPSDRAARVAAKLAAHGAWLNSDGRDGARADLSDLGPIPLENLAGADLYQATLPTDNGLPDEGVMRACTLVNEQAIRVGRVLMGLLFACGYGVLALNSALMIPGAPVRLPLFGSAAHPLTIAIGIPLLLLIGYLWLHGAIQHLCRQSRMLPKRLPDGSRPLDSMGALVATPVGPPLWRVAGWITRLLAWGAVPGLLAFYWGAFLPVATPAGTGLLGLLTATSAGIGMASLLRNTRKR